MNESIQVFGSGRRRRRRRCPDQTDGGTRARHQHHADTHSDENATTGTAPAAVTSEDDWHTNNTVAQRHSSHRSVVVLAILLLARHQGGSSAADSDVLSPEVENNDISKLGEAVTSTTKPSTQSPHFPHATFIAHGHPSDPHTHHLYATTYRYYHHNNNDQLPSHLKQHHDWFHATINNDEPTRLHGGFTYTDAHVPTPLTHRKYDYRDQADSDDGGADGNGTDDTDGNKLVAHHYFSVPGIIAADGGDNSFPDFDEFQHNVEEQIHIDEEIEKRIDYNVDHPNHEVGSTSVEDLSDIIQTITAKEKVGATKDESGAAEDMHQPISVPSVWDILGIKQFLVDVSLTGLSGHMIALERNCQDEGSVAPQLLLGEAEGESTATSDNKRNVEEVKKSSGVPSSAINNAEGFKLSMREIFKAMQSTTAVAGMASDASVAAAAMASVAVEAEKDIKRQDDMIEMSLAYPKLPASEQDAQKRAGEPFVIKREAYVGDEARGRRRRGSAGSDSSSFSDQTDFPELDPFAIETSHLLSASFALVSNSFGLVADTVRILGDTAGAATSASIKVVGATVKSVSGGLEGAGKRIELGRAGLREEALLEASKSKSGEKSYPKKRQPLTSEKLLSGEKGGVIGLLHRDKEDQPRPLVRGTRRVLGKSVRLLASVGSGIGESLLFAGSATETLASSTAGVAEEAVRLFEDFAGSLSSAFQVKEGKHSQDHQSVHVAPPSATKISDWYPLDSIQQQRPSIVSFGRHDSENLQDGESMEDDGAKLAEVENESFIENSQRLLRFVVSESIAFVDFSLADTEDVPSEVPELLGILLLCFVSSIILLSSSSGDGAKSFSPTCESEEGEKGDARPEGEAISQQAVPPIPSHIIRPNRPHRASYCVGAGILIGGEKHEETLDSDSLTVDEIDPIDKQEPIADTKAFEETKDKTPPAALRLPRRVFACIWLLLRAFIIEPFHITFCIIRFWVLFFLDKRVILMGIYGVAGLYVSRASQLRSLAIARNAEASGFRSVMTAAASGSTIRESAVWFNGLLDEMWRVPVVDDAMDVSQPNLSDEYPTFITKAMKHALRKRSCRKVTGRNNRGESIVLCTDKKPYGGLEPYISSILGESVIDILKTTSASRPSDITYIYLNSFTLGSVPPIIRAMKLTSMNDDDSTVKFDVDLDVLLGDSSIVLGE